MGEGTYNGGANAQRDIALREVRIRRIDHLVLNLHLRRALEPRRRNPNLPLPIPKQSALAPPLPTKLTHETALRGLPVSRVNKPPSSGMNRSHSSPSLRTRLARSTQGSAAHAGKAVRAPASAASTSAWVARGTAAMGARVQGERIESVDGERCAWPLMVCALRRARSAGCAREGGEGRASRRRRRRV